AQNFNFYRITADITRYWHLFYHRSLSLRLAGEFTRSLDDGDIPFYMLSELGRGETVRGFERGRFRDHDLILGALEYRYPIWDFADLFLFFDGGEVADDVVADFDWQKMVFGYGAGVRVWGANGEFINLMGAFSEDGFRFYLGLNQELQR
ncbi:MAG TPA: BamA/TamA family outer membrane protein, partial [Calditrichia bacterium]|nr:BamA/TamA family outer membrane protein [Calditrichia bacterium]